MYLVQGLLRASATQATGRDWPDAPLGLHLSIKTTFVAADHKGLIVCASLHTVQLISMSRLRLLPRVAVNLLAKCPQELQGRGGAAFGLRKSQELAPG